MKSSSRLTQGYLICLVGTILWSSTAVFIRYLTENYALPPLILAFWRDAFTAVALASALFFTNRARLWPGRQHLRFLLLYGFVLSIFNALWTVSVALNGAAVSTVLAYSSAGFTAILGWRYFGEKLGGWKVLAVSASLLGCAFVSGAYDLAAWQLNPVGILTGLLSGLAFAAYSLLGKAAAERAIYPWTTLLYTFAGAAGFLLLYNFLPFAGASIPGDLLWLGDSALGWTVLLLLALGPTIGGYGLYTVSLGYLPASVANLIATLEPSMTAILSFLLLGERFTGPQWLGSILIVAAVVILRLTEAPSQPAAPLADLTPGS
jgi:drug/metabolite transporter (DMT)-like permease